MGTVTIKLPPAPDQVRTARLLAVTVARRAGVHESLVDEIRLAIGEACGRAVHAHVDRGVPGPITVRLTDDEGFEAVVVDLASRPEPHRAVRRLPSLGVGCGGQDAAAIGLSILGAVVDDVTIEPVAPIGTCVRMRWPAAGAR
ncbi:MAG: ATP-binding protein [Frankiaceae bacterium]|jgi:anti-sigma regulatory factor (Ser/Thr protein kinase)|nr:ATP-binding protein [Frankiaceae bacterium]